MMVLGNASNDSTKKWKEDESMSPTLQNPRQRKQLVELWLNPVAIIHNTSLEYIVGDDDDEPAYECDCCKEHLSWSYSHSFSLKGIIWVINIIKSLILARHFDDVDCSFSRSFSSESKEQTPRSLHQNQKCLFPRFKFVHGVSTLMRKGSALMVFDIWVLHAHRADYKNELEYAL